MSSKSKPKPSKDQPSRQSSLFILQYKTRRVVVGVPRNYHALQGSIRRHFPEIPDDHRVSFHTKELDISRGAYAELSEDIWDMAIPLVDSLTVQSDPRASSSRCPGKRSKRERDSKSDSSCGESSERVLPKKQRRDPVPLPTPASTPSSEIPSSTSTSASVSTSASSAKAKAKTKKLCLNIHQFEGGGMQINCSASTSIRSILSLVCARMGLDPESWRAQWNGKWLVDQFQPSVENDKSVGEYGIRDGDDIWLFRHQIGGKPVIYLFPPEGTEVDVEVRLELVPEWRFSAVYPVVPIHTVASRRETLRWNVKAFSGGTLLEKNTGLEVSYLFWEAEALALQSANASSATLPSCSSPDGTFIPTQPHIGPTNSVVLEAAHITPYLDAALKALGLHTEARTSFITYWLPSFLKYTHIALRFLPQNAYERAAPLEVTPKPDVTVRIFMLFKGLKPDDFNPGGMWRDVVQRVNEDADVIDQKEGPERWKSVVGVDDRSKMLDNMHLFRAIEWGGMEVVS